MRSGESFYHAPAAGVTDEDPDPPRRIRFDYDRTLAYPDAEPVPPPPKPGESLLAWADRAVSEDPFVRFILALGGVELKPLLGMRPAELTVPKWNENCRENKHEPVPDPANRRFFPEDWERLLGRELECAAERVRVAICDRLRGGEAMKGRTGPAYSIKTVPLDLLDNPDMEFQRDGGFRPVPRHGKPPPSPDLMVFGEVTLGPAETQPETKGEAESETGDVAAEIDPTTPTNAPAVGSWIPLGVSETSFEVIKRVKGGGRVTKQVEKDMYLAVTTETITLDEFRRLSEPALAKRFGASREIVVPARKRVLARLKTEALTTTRKRQPQTDTGRKKTIRDR